MPTSPYKPNDIPIPAPKADYDSIAAEYARLVESDPAKMFVQYPSALRLLGDVAGQTVLDVGCGSGLFDRELATRGARVTGYDISPGQIENAQKAEEATPLGITYTACAPQDFRASEKFDQAVSVLVLHYAKDPTDLTQMFRSTHEAIKDTGKFATILANPELKRLGETRYNRKFTKIGDGKMRVEFFHKGQEGSFSADYSDFSKKDYENAATTAGFTRFEWVPLKVENDGKETLGADYWQGFEEDCPYVGFIAYKE